MTRPAVTRERRGQALAELAVIGGIMLIALAGLVRIGLRYNYGQQTTQEAFRRALKAAHDKQPAGQASVQVHHDRYIPDPTRPFAVGQTSLFSGAAAVTWGNRMRVHQLDLETEIPTQDLYINTDSRDPSQALARRYQTGRFLAWIANPSNRYRRLVRALCNDEADSDDEYEDCKEPLRYHRRKIENGVITLNRHTGFLDVPVVGGAGVTRWHHTVIVLDGCAGQVADPEICRRQCLKLKCGPNATKPHQIDTCLAQNKNVLPQPEYCCVLLDPAQLERRKDHRHGFDATNTVRKIEFDGYVAAGPVSQLMAVEQDEKILGDPGQGISGRVIRTQDPLAGYAETETSVPYDDPNRNRVRAWTTQ